MSITCTCKIEIDKDGFLEEIIFKRPNKILFRTFQTDQLTKNRKHSDTKKGNRSKQNNSITS